jgi:hypothetical protein
MPTTSEQTQTVKELLESTFAEMSGKNRDAVEKYVELEKRLLEQYQKYIAEELSSNNEVLQNFTKMMMACCMQVMAFQRDNRSRFLELQRSISDAHLKFLDQVKDSLSRSGQSGPPGESSDDSRQV